MNTRPLITTLLALLAWVGTGGWGMAEAQTIVPVDANDAPIAASPVTITLSTANWLPAPSGPNASVTITVNGAVALDGESPITIRLVCPDGNPVDSGTCANLPFPGYNPVASAGALGTSAYPGVCTNYPNVSATDPVPVDFTLSGNLLTSLDCGGMAVIEIGNVAGGPFRFVIPQDSDADGIPDLWEAKFGAASGAISLSPTADLDNDGLSSFDEYRGVMLSETALGAFLHTRLHPTEPDLFVSLINPGCDTAASTSLLGGGTTTYVAGTNPSDGRAIFASLYSLRPATANDPPGPRVHPVGYPAGPPATHQEVTTGEGVDDYRNCTYDPASSQLVFNPLLGDLDRLITGNAVYPVSESPQTTLSFANNRFTAGVPVFNRTHVGAVLTAGNATATITGFVDQTMVDGTVTAGTFPSSVASGSWRLSRAGQKWLRCVESNDVSSTTVFATGGWSTANQPVSCTLYTKRIENRLKDPTSGLIAKGGSRKIRIQTFDGSRWTDLFTQADTSQAARDAAISRLVAEVIRFYAAMEWTHSGKVRAALGACGSHDCAGTGYIVDKDIVQVIDKSTSGFNTFRVPTLANSTIRAEFKHRHP